MSFTILGLEESHFLIQKKHDLLWIVRLPLKALVQTDWESQSEVLKMAKSARLDICQKLPSPLAHST